MSNATAGFFFISSFSFHDLLTSMNKSQSAAHSGVGFAGAEEIHEQGPDQQKSLCDRLPIGGDTHKVQAVAEALDNEQADKAIAETPRPPVKATPPRTAR
jgi:hypothetical protein